MKKEDNSLIDVESAETWNYRRKVSPSELKNTIEQFIVYVHRNEAHFTYIYVCHTNVSEADNIYKNPPPNVISPIFLLLLFLFRSGAPPMTLLTAGAFTDPRLPATASNVCTTDARLGGVGRVAPPNKNPGYAVDVDETVSTVLDTCVPECTL